MKKSENNFLKISGLGPKGSGLQTLEEIIQNTNRSKIKICIFSPQFQNNLR